MIEYLVNCHRNRTVIAVIIEETYLQHMAVASWFAVKLFTAAGAAMIHALIPCLFEKSASSLIAQLYERTQTRIPEEV